ncbi:MAG TPA: ribosomal protein S18-alanine N-acetyltransferase [Terriglobales bacterium]|jgi:ribosomal-protein-alanine N-acetyltransferase
MNSGTLDADVRLATPQDFPVILEIANSTQTGARWSEKQYIEILAEGSARKTLVIETDDKLQGFIVAHIVGDEWEIENMVIAPQMQRRGLGEKLLKQLMKFASHNAAKIVLEVREANHPANNLYKKCGFLATGQRKNYYQNPAENAVLYEYRFS